MFHFLFPHKFPKENPIADAYKIMLKRKEKYKMKAPKLGKQKTGIRRKRVKKKEEREKERQGEKEGGREGNNFITHHSK